MGAPNFCKIGSFSIWGIFFRITKHNLALPKNTLCLYKKKTLRQEILGSFWIYKKIQTNINWIIKFKLNSYVISSSLKTNEYSTVFILFKPLTLCVQYMHFHVFRLKVINKVFNWNTNFFFIHNILKTPKTTFFDIQLK